MEVAPEKHCIGDHPEVQNAWVDYLTDCWEPWVREMRQWEQVQAIYEQVDFMRRRLEEAEERYELVVAIGLVQWRDSVGVTVKRHVLTAPAEISLHAEQGILTVGPAASFERLRVELDMLELQYQPVLEGTDIEVRLENLDLMVWTSLVSPKSFGSLRTEPARILKSMKTIGCLSTGQMTSFEYFMPRRSSFANGVRQRMRK